MVRRILLVLAGSVVVLLLAASAYLVVAPPELLRVGTGYAAKIVCSNVFLAGRDAHQVLSDDVQAPGNPILKFLTVGVDKDAGLVSAKFLGAFAGSAAVYRPGLGCAAVPDGDIDGARKIALAAQPEIAAPGDGLWPDGATVAPETGSSLAPILADASLTGPGMRAVVVVKDGRIIGETYGAGFSAETPLIGWSMTKTVNAALLGRVMLDGKVGLDDAGLFPEWSDDRKHIKLRDLLAMTSGLSFNEDYGDVADVTRMLYLEPDMAAFAAAQPATDKPGAVFNYSTGTAVMLARLWMEKLADRQAALSYPRAALFDPLGMTSAVMEADEAGTLVGGSYVYATARDRARFGQFLLQDGVWAGQRLLPQGFVTMMATSNGLPGGYSQAQTWIEGPHEGENDTPVGLPADTFWLEGHDGQTVAIMPSAHLVVVRMGLTPWKLDYWPEHLDKAIVDALASAG